MADASEPFIVHRAERELLRTLLEPEGAYPSSILVSDLSSPTYASALIQDVLAEVVAEHRASHSVDASSGSKSKGKGKAKAKDVAPEESLCIVQVSPVSTPTLAALAASIQRQLGYARVDTRMDAAKLVAELRNTVRFLSSKKQEVKFILLVEDAERILDLWSSEVLEILLRLDEHCNCVGRLCILFQSALPWSRFRTLSGRSTLLTPITIDLRAPRSDGLIKFLKVERDRLLQSSGTAAQLSSNTFDDFVRLARDILAPESIDLDELRTLTATLWYGLNLPMILEEERSEGLQQSAVATQKLFTSKAIMSQVATMVASREITPRKWLESTELDLRRARAVDEEGTADEVEATLHKRKRRRCEVSITSAPWQPSPLSTFILISAFVASFNPSRLDIRYFQQTEESVNRGKRGKVLGVRSRADEDAGEKLDRPQLIGPKAFSLERLLAILESLLTAEEPEGLGDPFHGDDPRRWGVLAKSTAVLQEINALVSRRELLQLGGSGGLDGMQYRVNVQYERVKETAKFVGMELHERLWNFSS